MATHNYGILSSWAMENADALEKKKEKLLNQVKLDLFETLDVDSKIVNRNDLADKLSKNRFISWIGIPHGEVEIWNKKYSIDEKKYGDLLEEYKKALEIENEADRAKALAEIDTKLAERLILDSWDYIEFKWDEGFAEWKGAEEESKIAFEMLNNLDAYKGKIERVAKKKNFVKKEKWDRYVIKWTDRELSIIERKFKEEVKKQEKIEEDKKKQREAIAEIKKENKELKKKWELNDEKDREIEELKRKQEEQERKIKELTEQLNKKDDESVESTSEDEWESTSEDGWDRFISDDSWDDVSGDSGESSTDIPDPVIEQKEWVATISNVTQVNRAIVQREADEELRQRYEDTSWFNFVWKANLFLRRKFIKDRMVNKKMRGRKGMDWSDASQAAADRHQIEEQNNLADRMKVVIRDIDSANYPETRRRLDNLLGRLTWKPTTVPPWQREITDDNFKTEFQNILDMSWKIFDRTRPGTATSTNRRPMSDIIKSNNIGQLSTNILMQANKFREQQFLTWWIADHIARNPWETAASFDTYCRNAIKKYVDTYNDMPDFLEQMWVKLDDVDASKEIKRLQAHNWALTMIAAQSLKLRIQMLDDWWEAYNVKKQWWVLTKIGRFFDDPTWGENTKFGRWMNKHQNIKEAFWWIWWGAKLWAMMTPAFLLAPMWPLAVASWVGGMSFLTTLVKKKAHYERENRSYQRMQATNLTDYRNKRTQLANEVAWMKWREGRFWGKKARVRDQYKDYVLTTQDQLSLSPDLLSRIERRLQDSTALSSAEQINLAADLADGLARLDYHKKSGQNFLGSDNPLRAEEEYRALQNAVMWGAKRLGISVNDLRARSPYDAYYNNTVRLIEDGTGDEFDNQGYLQARKRFKNRSNTKSWMGALKAWAVSFGLSYLASSLASWTKTETVETKTNMHHWQTGWEYNLGDYNESSFVTGDVNPTMRGVIDWNTVEISWWELYSSVDSVRCSASFWASQLSSAQSSLASSLANPTVAGNPDLVNAVNNYVAEATRGIHSVAWLSAWNQDLALARAIEAVNEGILDPIIASWNTSVVINPSCLHWANWWIQSSTWAVWQAFRNMGILNLDFVQKGTEEVVSEVTRAIPIPVGLNTFWTKGSKGAQQQRNP